MVKKEFSIKDIRTLKNLNKDKLDFYIDYLKPIRKLKEFRLKMLRKLKEISLNTLTKVLNGITNTQKFFRYCRHL